MISTYELTPIDTLFFRGSTPMEAGLQKAASMFPPPVSVIKGAFWTAYCNEKGIKFTAELINGEIPIEVVSFFIKRGDKFYTKAPATWYYDSDDKVKHGEQLVGKNLCIAADHKTDFEKLGMVSSASDVVFVVPTKDAKPLTEAWVDLNFLQNPKATFKSDTVLFNGEIFSSETRTGVGLDSNKHAVRGELYTATHIRLKDDVSIVVSLQTEKTLAEGGKMLLGGEKRLVRFEKTDNQFLANEKSEQYVSLIPIQATDKTLRKKIVACGKLFTVAGWDLQKGFHKPTVSWIPQGAVFNDYLSGCIQLKNI